MAAHKYNEETRSFDLDSKGVIWHHQSIEETFATLIDQYYWQEEQNKRLREENQKLKDGIWEKEEVARLKKENERMRWDYYRGFPISEEEEKRINAFKDTYKGQKFGAIGGAFRYEFVPTGIGTFGAVYGPDDKKLVFQEAD